MIDTNTVDTTQWDGIGVFVDINGNPTNMYDEEIAIIFDTCGTYTVWLRATDDNGCDSLYSFDVIVHALPEPNFSTEEVCQGNCTPIIDSSLYNLDFVRKFAYKLAILYIQYCC